MKVSASSAGPIPSVAPSNVNLQRTLLVDVRTPAEFGSAHIAESISLPLDKLDVEEVGRLAQDRDLCVLVCASGSRARTAAEKLRDAGLSSLAILEGGIAEWEQEGLPLIRGKRKLPLERQVKIGAGTLVLTGAVLGTFVHPGWVGLCVFVGAGMIFAGVTGICGMAILLSRLPWNRR
jgi:rhodanese-related sulfurtransferase